MQIFEQIDGSIYQEKKNLLCKMSFSFFGYFENKTLLRGRDFEAKTEYMDVRHILKCQNTGGPRYSRF
jgi:hypothetical protein